MNEELKPCPFCGGHAELYSSINDEYIAACATESCNSEELMSRWLPISDAVKAWNENVLEARKRYNKNE